jgi:hypothetical protein
MTSRAIVLALAAFAGSAGCAAPQTMYHWGEYDRRVYAYHRDPKDREAWVEGLMTIILESEAQGQRTPPGIYAEYGYALQEEGRNQEAVAYYQREKAQWPEAGVLMDKMIRNASRAGSPATSPSAVPEPTGPAGALEGKP